MAIKCNEKNLTVKCGWTFASRRTNSGKQKSWVFSRKMLGKKPVSLLLRGCLSCSLSVPKSDRCFCMSVLTLSRVLFWRCRLDMVYLVWHVKGGNIAHFRPPNYCSEKSRQRNGMGFDATDRKFHTYSYAFECCFYTMYVQTEGFICIDSIGLPLANGRFDCEAQRKRLNNIRVAHVVLQKHYSVTYNRTLVDRGAGKRGHVPEKENKVRKKRFQGQRLLQKSFNSLRTL